MPAAVSCPQPGTPLHGYAVHSGGTAVNDTVEYFCNANHVMQGNATSVCGSDGTWSQPTPNCERLPVPTPLT